MSPFCAVLTFRHSFINSLHVLQKQRKILPYSNQTMKPYSSGTVSDLQNFTFGLFHKRSIYFSKLLEIFTKVFVGYLGFWLTEVIIWPFFSNYFFFELTQWGPSHNTYCHTFARRGKAFQKPCGKWKMLQIWKMIQAKSWYKICIGALSQVE